MNNCIFNFILTMETINPSMSIISTSEVFPEIYIVDNEAEPYWLIMMAELSEGCGNDDACMGGTDLEGEGKQVLVGICAMAKKSQSKPMKEILTRLEEFEYIKIVVFPEEVILKESVEDWPIVDCLISFHSKGFPLDKAINYADLRNPFIINNLPMQYDIQDRRRVYAILESEGIEIPRYAVLDRDSADPKQPFPDHELVESEDHVEVNGVIFNKPFVEKPVSAEDHNIYIYYPTSAGGGSQRLFRKIGSRSSVYSPESRVRKTGSYIYEDFMPTDGTDVKVYTVGPDYAHAEARKSPALDGKVERDSEGKEIRYPVILSNAEKLISRKVCLAFKQTVCGFDLLRANGQSFVCDVNGFSFVKNSNKYYDDCAKILGNMILRELAPTLHIPWSVPFQLDDPPIVPTTFGKMMELRCVVAVIRHGDRTPKQKMKVEVRHPKFFEIFAKYDGYKHGHVKLKRPKQLQEILDTARSLLAEIQHRAAGPELEEKQGKLEQLKSVLEMYGHFSGINRKVQMKYQPRGRPRGSSSDDGNNHNRLGEPSLVLILKWGGELTPAGRIQAEELGRIFRCMYPGGQGRHLSEEDTEMLPNHGEYAGAQGLGLLRLHSTFRHDLKIYASDEGRVQMTAAAFAKGLLALEGELTPILVQMVKSANTNGLLDNDCDSSKYQNMVKTRLHELLQQDREFTREDREQINPGNALSINAAMDFVKNPVKCCQHVHALIQKLMDIVRIKKDDPKTKDAILYHGETWELMGRRWGKIEKDFCTKNKRFDISKIPDIYDCIKYDLQHNNHTLQFDHAEELYIYAKYLADIVIPQEYGLTVQEKLTIGQGICTPLLKKIRADLQRNIEESGEETVNRLNPRYSHGVSSPGRHVRTRLYFTSESHVHSLLTVLRYGGLLDVVKDEQWRRAMEYVSMVSELNYMSQIVVMLYEDPTKDPSSEERFHVELHFSPGVNCCVQKNLPPGPGFRPHSRNESSHNMGESGGSGQDSVSQCSTRIEEEDTELSILEDEINPQIQTETSPTVGNDVVDSTLDSPTTSRGIDMMDLDPNMMDEPYDSGFLQSSAPIPIRHVMRIINSRTVAGHEAARLGSQLAASQRQRREREASVMVEPRARSYDHQHQEKAEKAADKLQYQSLDAVNKEEKTEHSNYYKNTLNVPVYLGQPIALPHSISSPELPIPCVQTSIPISPPLITVHDIPLASPINYNYKKNTSAPSPPKDLLMSDLDSYHLSSVNQEQLKNKKTHGGFHTEIILPNIKVDDTRPSIIQPDPTCTARRHRHSISGQMSYFKLLGYNVSKKLTGSANSLFSTAVISGSSSAPNLKDMIPSHAMIPQHVAAIEGFGGVPPIRPLETLHNALSLRQLDSFLEMMTSAPLFRTPASSPPKYPSPGGSVNPNLNVGGISREYQSSDLEAVRYCKKLNNVPLYITPTPIQYKSCGDGDTCDIRNQPSPTSPNSTGWSSEPQSFLSSEPSSPAPTSTGECSMSISLISNDGAPSYSGAPKFPTTPGLDLDFNDFCMNIDQENHEGRGSVSYTDYYSNEDGQIRKGPSYTSTTQKTVVSSDDLPVDTVDDDEEHTLTLRQTEAQKKQDVKLLFEQVENPNATKSTVGYKKIGRFRVESMEISDDDVRIKEPSSACSSTDKNKLLTLQKMETTNAERGPTHRNKETRHKRKNFSRSQSVSTPKTFVAKSDTNFSFKSVKSKESSFSAMTDKDLEKWKLSSTKSDPSTSCTETQKEPILTMASSLTDSPSVTIGFDIQDKKNE
ncbi:inositol hexakisphosphate and diphosphoinositol-pentakisphosphate kinase 2-like isoform X3 [Vespa mandarinia]|uniref:inositol hexakisphosphate and diphosphoinositol-pentakisphosphate kinase 2-like isoform X3 n=1 Tax=Vespa mandarinia TaxID=7446 RepID=UPI00161B2967|nr:inositol hexakisphosphate and diphosphoinositol-pentakisphosphate kinase 2-like isoform X3 [Vespa mandarinia]